MRISKIFIASLLVPALMTPAVAAGTRAVRPAVKAVSVAPSQDRALAVRVGAPTKNQSELAGPFLIPLIALLAIVVGGVVVASGGGDDPISPGN